MPKILSIDTATEKALICLGYGEEILSFTINEAQKTHASFVQPAIQQLLKNTGLSLQEIDAIAVSNGPGSYTGLRVGLSSAKGICYALQKPLILINTLEVMAKNAILQIQDPKGLYAPMIDARRMEVFTAVYDADLQTLLAPEALILSDAAFRDMLSQRPVFFFGSGAAKWQKTTSNSQALFGDIDQVAGLHLLAHEAFLQKRFAELAYAEPYYLKSFYTTHKSY